MKIEFFASNSGMLFPALYGSFGTGYEFEVISSSASQIVIRQPVSGAQTTITGQSFTFDASGNPTGGVVAQVSVDQGGSETVRLTDVSKKLPDFWQALEDATNKNFQTYRDLYKGETITVDATQNLNLSLSMNLPMSNPADFSPDMASVLNVKGSAQNDSIVGGKLADVLLGQAGNDSIDGSFGADVLRGNLGGDGLSGGKGNDHLFGGKGTDSLMGNGGRDRLRGGTGDDNLWGHKGNDWLKGGEGADTFSFVAGRNEGNDVIVDFTDGEDIFLLVVRKEGDSDPTFDDVTISAAGADTIVSVVGGTSILIRNVDSELITQDDFLWF